MMLDYFSEELMCAKIYRSQLNNYKKNLFFKLFRKPN